MRLSQVVRLLCLALLLFSFVHAVPVKSRTHSTHHQSASNLDLDVQVQSIRSKAEKRIHETEVVYDVKPEPVPVGSPLYKRLEEARLRAQAARATPKGPTLPSSPTPEYVEAKYSNALPSYNAELADEFPRTVAFRDRMALEAWEPYIHHHLATQYPGAAFVVVLTRGTMADSALSTLGDKVGASVVERPGDRVAVFVLEGKTVEAVQQVARDVLTEVNVRASQFILM